MTDDIVTRLRKRAIVLFSNGADGDAFIDEQAADEIERLRELLWKYENCEMVKESPCEPDWVDGECLPCTEHRKAVRGG